MNLIPIGFGSPQETVNTYAVDNYKISCTFKSDNLGLVANARNKDNYVLFNICKDSVSVYEISDNAWNDNVPYKKITRYIPCYRTFRQP